MQTTNVAINRMKIMAFLKLITAVLIVMATITPSTEGLHDYYPRHPHLAYGNSDMVHFMKANARNIWFGKRRISPGNPKSSLINRPDLAFSPGNN